MNSILIKVYFSLRLLAKARNSNRYSKFHTIGNTKLGGVNCRGFMHLYHSDFEFFAVKNDPEIMVIATITKEIMYSRMFIY